MQRLQHTYTFELMEIIKLLLQKKSMPINYKKDDFGIVQHFKRTKIK